MRIGGFGPWSFAATALALAGTAVAWPLSGGNIFSPGALHAGDDTPHPMGGVTSHAALAGRCGACHAPRWGSERMADRCVACHTDIQAELRDTTALHGQLGDATGCMACHTEHVGAAGDLTRSGELGVAHDRLGFSLATHRKTADGARFGCADCHGGGNYRFDDARCESCHREYQAPFVTRHVAEWGSDCRACHDGVDRFSKPRFDHDRLSFPLAGAHRTATCAACHERVRTLADFRNAPADCIGCHRADDEHRGGFGEDCGACHGADRWTGARIKHDVFPLDHGESGPIACATCHQDKSDYKRYTCYGCHEHSPARVQAEHEDERVGGSLDNCIRCHAGGSKHGEGGEGDEHEGRERRGRERRERD